MPVQWAGTLAITPPWVSNDRKNWDTRQFPWKISTLSWRGKYQGKLPEADAN